MKINDVILQTVTNSRFHHFDSRSLLVLFGHNNPGGGFIGGLVLASAFVLLFLAFDIETVHKGIPFDFKWVAALGVFLAVTSGFGALLFDTQFLSSVIFSFQSSYFW